MIEDIRTCEPFIETAEYQIAGGLVNEIRLGREWRLEESVKDLEAAIPGLLVGGVRLWGRPTQAGAFWKPYGEGTRFRFVALLWTSGRESLIVRYTPSDTIRQAMTTMNHAVPLNIIITLCRDRSAEDSIAWLELGGRDEAVDRALEKEDASLSPDNVVLH